MSGFARGCAAAVVLLLVLGAVPASAAGATERVIVRLKAGAGETREVGRSLMAEHGGTLGPVYAGVMKGFAGTVPAGRLEALRNNPRVDVVIPDAPISGENAEVPPGVRRIGAERVAGSLIGTGTAVDADIAILDTGVNPHSDLNLAGGVNCAQDIGCTATSFADGHGHGTHVAGTAAAKDNGAGVVGTAPGARVWGVKVLGDNNGGYLSWFIAGLDWVVARGDIEVANASLTGAGWSPVNDAVARATDAGVVVVVAAGNDAIDASSLSPASAPNAITVSAYQDGDGAPGALQGGGDDTWASFSNYGPVVDVAAPGVFVNSTSRTGGYVSMSGTSMASPHVAGAAAVYITTHNVAPSATRWQTVLDAFRGAWGAGQQSSCGFTGGRSSEPVVIMGGCAGGDTVPPTPVSLTAVAGNQQVGLRWTASSDASGIAEYRIYRAAGATGPFAVLTTLAPGTLSFTDTTVVNNMQYRYYVTAVDAAAIANTSSASPTVSATPNDPSAAPVPTLDGQGWDRKATLQWLKVSEPAGVKGYQLWRATGSAEPVLRAKTGSTTVKFTDTSVLNDTTYTYTLRYVDSLGRLSEPSAPVVITPIDNMPPSVPSPSILVGDGKLTLKWAASKDSSGVASYTIYRAVGTEPFGPPITVSGSTLSYVDTGLINYTSYRYVVAATDTKSQTSLGSAVKSAMPKDLTGPAAVTVTGSASDGRADISWTEATDVSGIGSYRVYRAMGTSTSYTQVASLPASARTWTQTGLFAGTSYRYLVRPVDTKNNLGGVPTAAAVTTPTTGMGVPAIDLVVGTPGSTTTPVTFGFGVRSDTAAAVMVGRAKITFVIHNAGGAVVATKAVTTGTSGLATLKLSLPRGTTYSATITGVTAVGRTWDGVTPANSVTVS